MPIDSAPVWCDLESGLDAPNAGYDAIPEPEPEPPIVDPVRVAMLKFAADLFLDRDNAGTYRRMDGDGRLAKGVIAPWSKRGGFTVDQRRQAQEILRQITPWLFRYDETAKCWVANLRDYRRAYDVVNAIDRAYTPAPRGK